MMNPQLLDPNTYALPAEPFGQVIQPRSDFLPHFTWGPPIANLDNVDKKLYPGLNSFSLRFRLQFRLQRYPLTDVLW